MANNWFFPLVKTVNALGFGLLFVCLFLRDASFKVQKEALLCGMRLVQYAIITSDALQNNFNSYLFHK